MLPSLLAVPSACTGFEGLPHSLFHTTSSQQATLPLQDYVVRLAGIFAFFFAFIGGPISFQTFDPLEQVGPGARAGSSVA